MAEKRTEPERRVRPSWAQLAAWASLAVLAAWGGLALASPPDAPYLYCGKCETVRRALPIVYGLPGYKLMEAAERGEVVLGGCVVSSNDPARACATCREPITAWGNLFGVLVL